VDFWDLTKLVFRRWYVALPLLAVTAALTVWTTVTVKPDYKATAYVQLIPPAEASVASNVAELRNPWLDLGLGGLDTAATYTVVDKTFLNQLKEEGLSDNVVITAGYPAPIATIEVIASSQQVAGLTTDRVVEHFDQTVKALQSDYGVKPAGMILTRRLDTGRNLAQTGGKVKRALIAVAGAGLLLTAGVTVGFDALLRRRRNRRARKAGFAGPADQTVATTVMDSALQRSGASAAHGYDGGSSPPIEQTPNGQGHSGSSAQDPSGTGSPRPMRLTGPRPQLGSEMTILIPRVVANPPAGEGEGTRL
jgi:hypothetical protein